MSSDLLTDIIESNEFVCVLRALKSKGAYVTADYASKPEEDYVRAVRNFSYVQNSDRTATSNILGNQ